MTIIDYNEDEYIIEVEENEEIYLDEIVFERAIFKLIRN